MAIESLHIFPEDNSEQPRIPISAVGIATILKSLSSKRPTWNLQQAYTGIQRDTQQSNDARTLESCRRHDARGSGIRRYTTALRSKLRSGYQDIRPWRENHLVFGNSLC